MADKPVFLFLTSGSRPRYREDALRTLAAPLYAEIQFRYRKDLLNPNLLTELSDASKGSSTPKAIICYLAEGGVGPQPLYPLRFAEVVSFNPHGTTVSVILKVGAFLQRDSSKFTVEVTTDCGGENPKKDVDTGPVKGRFVLRLPKCPPDYKSSFSLETWEGIISELAALSAFNTEPFFWTVLGTEKAGSHSANTDKQLSWPKTLARDSTGNALIYHFRPTSLPAMKPTERHELKIAAGDGVAAAWPESLVVDSPYDLNRWRFKPNARGWGESPGWFRITSPSGWVLDLPVRVASAWFRAWLVVIVIGVLVAAPYIINLLQNAQSSTEKLFVAGAALLLGLGAGAAAVFGIKRID